jgi:hypothetical protein
MEQPEEHEVQQAIDHLAALQNPRDDPYLIALANGLELLLPLLPPSAQGHLNVRRPTCPPPSQLLISFFRDRFVLPLPTFFVRCRDWPRS